MKEVGESQHPQEGAMTSGPDYESYAKCMEEIKRRQIAVAEILQGSKTTTFRHTNVEFVALQFRKIFELVVLATPASHQHLFEGLMRKLARNGKSRRSLRSLARKILNSTQSPSIEFLQISQDSQMSGEM
jgi:hypothetical protein